MEKKLRIYIETSVISHLDAPDRPDRMGETLLLWKKVTAEKFEIVIGFPVITELEKCYEPKRSFMLGELQKIPYSLVVETEKSRQLAAEYIKAGGLPGKCEMDARHLALATLADCDMIVSWNFSHIVTFRAMSAVKIVNESEKFKSIFIVPPTSLLEEDSHE